MKKIFIWVGVVAVILVGGFFVLNAYIYEEKQEANGTDLPETNDPAVLDENLWNESDEQVVCTMDAKMCPDGSYVGRQGTNCEFAACPVTITPTPAPSEPVACTMDAKICPDGSAVGRQGPNCEFAPCPGEAR